MTEVDFEEFFLATHPRLLRFLARVVDLESAHDIAIDSLGVLWELYFKDATHPVGNRQELLTKVFQIARGKLSNILRAQSRRAKLFERLRGNHAWSVIVVGDIADQVTDDSVEVVVNYLRSLPSGERHVMQLTLDGFKPAEIAGILDVSSAAVSSSLYRARNTLRGLYAKMEEGDASTR